MSSDRPILSVRGLVVSLDGERVLSGVDLDIGPAEFVALMGRNGTGKTTLLRSIAGFERPDAGLLRYAGRDLAEVPVHRRGLGFLSQDPALFPGRTAWENIAYGLELARRPAAEVEARVAELVALLHLGGLEARGSGELSGGERQRVALARTLAPGPRLVLLDEPFAAIDPELRSGLRAEFRSALRALGIAALLVTHDRDEGLFLGDRVAILDEGRIAAIGRPEEVYGAPGSPSVARFLGYNVLDGGAGPVAVAPADLLLTTEGGGVAATVEAIGATVTGRSVLLRTANGERVEAGPIGEGPLPSTGTTVRLRWRRSIPLPR